MNPRLVAVFFTPGRRRCGVAKRGGQGSRPGRSSASGGRPGQRSAGDAPPNEATGLLIAGAGGVLVDEGRPTHEGRRCLLVTREDDTAEMEDLLDAMGIIVVERLHQKGHPDPRRYLGRGRLDDVADELSMRPAGHPWHEVDLVVMHVNATPGQLVTVTETLGVEVWDRVRLLLALFTTHAASVEARQQVRLAQLRADRPILRELAHQLTTGERAGYGGGGRQLVDDLLRDSGREIARLTRGSKDARRRHERRSVQRERAGIATVGLAGYTNAGKSSLFRALCGREVLVEDQLFSTLETTTGRLATSPRVLITDTIGFLDRLPTDLLDAFRATLAESLTSDLLLVVIDVADEPDEFARKLATSQRELLERLPTETRPNLLVVLTKADLADDTRLARARDQVDEAGLPAPVAISSHSGAGMDDLREAIEHRLFGEAKVVRVATYEDGSADGRWRARVHELGRVADEGPFEVDGTLWWRMVVWAPEAEIGRVVAEAEGRVEADRPDPGPGAAAEDEDS